MASLNHFEAHLDVTLMDFGSIQSMQPCCHRLLSMAPNSEFGRKSLCLWQALRAAAHPHVRFGFQAVSACFNFWPIELHSPAEFLDFSSLFGKTILVVNTMCKVFSGPSAREVRLSFSLQFAEKELCRFCLNGTPAKSQS